MPPLIAHNPPLTAACTTPGCLLASSYLKQYVDLNIDPCSDFFQYTCGSWLNSPRIKQKPIAYNAFDEVEEENLKRILNILEGTYEDILKNSKTNDDGFNIQEQADIDRENFQLAQDYYRVCTNEKQVAAFGPTSIFGDIVYIQKTLDGTTDKADALARILAFFTRHKFQTLVKIRVVFNTDNHDFDAPYIETYDAPEVTEEYVTKALENSLATPKDNQYIVTESKKAGLSLWSSEQVKAATKNYINIQEKLQIIKKPSDSADEDYTTLEQVKSVSKNINWEAFLTDMISPEYVKLPNAELLSNKLLLVKIDELLSDFSIGQLKDFFSVHFVLLKYDDLIIRTPPNTSDDSSVTEKTDNNREEITTKPSQRQLYCAGEVGDYLFHNIGRYFAWETLGSIKKVQAIEAFVKEFQDAFIKHLPDVKWLDATTRKLAGEKIDAIKARVAISTESPDWRTPASIKEYFQDYAVNASSYYRSKSSLTAWITDKRWKALGTEKETNKWSDDKTVQNVNAAYIPWRNQIEIDIGILQGFQYNPDFPGYINYGAVGATIGHEFTHSLDSEGHKLDLRGYPNPWFSEKATAEFKEGADCFVKQFSEDFLYDENQQKVPINGEQTLAENIADAGGLSLALVAYREYASKLSQPESPPLGFEKLTPEQLLYVSFGVSQCAYLPSNLDGLDPKDNHAPWKFRILNPLKDKPEFAKAFNCPVGSPMNPYKDEKDRCAIW